MSTEEKPTVEIEAPPAWAVKLTEKVVTGFAGVDQRLDAMEANIELQGGSVHDIGSRMTSLESRVGKMEERTSANSDRVRQESKSNLGQDSAIAHIVEKVDALTEKTDVQTQILGELRGIAGNPVVRKVAYVLATALLTYLASKGWLVK